ncbi:myosin heavy chain, non-muscle [Anabrus simplex]|uniref:myosin heavy chain, non-muscle n=1 Tax=Anabrus simplex TaxID=316456 RepID=UPI0034DCE87E
MSSRLSRPRRTKVYDCNYSMGERYYRPVVDDLDRKYSTRGHIAEAAAAADASINSLRSAMSENESSLNTSLRRSAARAMEDNEEEIVRRRPASSLMEDYDSIFDSRVNSDSMSRSRALIKASMDESEDDTIQHNLKRLRAARAARQAIEDEVDTTITSKSLRRNLSDNFSEKVLGTVGLKHSDIAKARVDLADDAINRRVLKVIQTTTTTGQTEENPSWTRWCKMSDAPGDDYDEQSFTRARRAARARMADLEAEVGNDRAADAAAERARKTRARLADIEDEMEALAIRGAQREKRAADLKAFIQENETGTDVSNNTSAKSSMRVKKFSSSLQSEKKTVTF